MGLLKVQLPGSTEVGADPSVIDVAIALEFVSFSMGLTMFGVVAVASQSVP